MDNAFRRQAMRIAQHEGAWCTAGLLKTVTFFPFHDDGIGRRDVAKSRPQLNLFAVFMSSKMSSFFGIVGYKILEQCLSVFRGQPEHGQALFKNFIPDDPNILSLCEYNLWPIFLWWSSKSASNSCTMAVAEHQGPTAYIGLLFALHLG